MIRIAALLTLIASPALGQACKDINADTDRLACYDKQFGYAEGKTDKEPEADFGKWVLSSEKSPLDDSTTHTMYLESEEPVTCSFGNQSDRVIMFVRCLENTTAMFLSTHCHMADHNGYDVIKYRFDDEQPGSISANASTDNRALGLWSGRRSIPFLKKMMLSDTAVFRFTPFNENPKTVKFKTTGFREGVTALRLECGW